MTLLALLVAPVLAAGPAPTEASVASTAPAGRAAAAHEVVVTGEGVATYPAFDRSVERYAITTSDATGGTVTVTATTSDPGGVVSVDGRPVPGGSRTVTGLQPGEEVAVLVDDVDGSSVYSFVYLPAEFPTLDRTTPADQDPTYSHVMVTLGLYGSATPGPFFETALDANGVPAVLMTNRSNSSMDFKLQDNGHYSVARGSGNPGYPNSDIVELDEQFREVDRHRTVGLVHTDAHDSLLLEDGSRYLLAYEPASIPRSDPDPPKQVFDAVVQHVSASGEVLFEWNSRPLLDETVVADTNPDYAHINSIEVMDDGHLLLSFRHLSAVLKVARHDRDGFEPGELIWKLGGRDSTFDFAAPDGVSSNGPCAQHTATELDNGNIMVFDNGSASMFGPVLCVDPDQPNGPFVQRVPSRVAEWEIDGTTIPDEETGVATLVRDHHLPNHHAIFAASAQDLAGGSLVGWASETKALVSEFDAAGLVRWELADTAVVNTDRYFTYRAFGLDLPDAIPPTVSAAATTTYIEGQRVRPVFSCSDRGGSSLHSCRASSVDTRTPGVRTFVVTARDGDGNVTRVTRRYRVVHRYRPDATIRAAGVTRVAGVGSYGARPQQLVQISRRQGTYVAFVRVRNNGAVPDRLTLTPSLRSRDFTARIVGSRVSPLLRPGQSWGVRLVVTPRASARRGDQAAVRVVARSRGNPARVDVIWLRARRS